MRRGQGRQAGRPAGCTGKKGKEGSILHPSIHSVWVISEGCKEGEVRQAGEIQDKRGDPRNERHAYVMQAGSTRQAGR